MMKNKKSGNLLRRLQKKRIKRRSSSNMKERSSSNVRNAGSVAEESGRPSNISLIESCYECPLSTYIDVTCDDNKLNKLIIRGNPTTEQLQEARFKLVTEFSEISNSGEAQAYSDAANSYYQLRNQILGFELSLKLLLVGKFDRAIEYLNQNGLKCSVPETEDDFLKLIESIQLKIKNRMAKYTESKSRLKTFSSGKGEKPTRKYYNRLLIMLSSCDAIKIQLYPKKMTVAEFAEYLNMFNEYQNQLKIRNNGRKH